MAKTVKVRIAVAVAPDGDWSSGGWKNARGDEAMDCVLEGIPEGEARYWLTAELAVPEVAEIAADVEAQS